jgi:hypothetical protein
MPGPLLQEYRLLTRPYRLALWGIMGRYKIWRQQGHRCKGRGA